MERHGPENRRRGMTCVPQAPFCVVTPYVHVTVRWKCVFFPN